MVANVQETDTAPSQNIDLTYDPAATDLSKILFFGTLSTPVSPCIFLEEEDSTITVTLQDMTTKFAEQSNLTTAIFPPIPPSHTDPSPDDNQDFSVNRDSDQQVTITAKKVPTHYLRPWALSLNVNVNAAGGPSEAVIMASPTLFIVMGPQPPQNALTAIALHYTRSTGQFSLDSAVELASLLFLVNSVIPLNIQINLQGEEGLRFHSTPITPLPNITPTVSNGGTTLTLPITLDAHGSAGFSFLIDVPTSGDPITVTSPDPILINATIGDG